MTRHTWQTSISQLNQIIIQNSSISRKFPQKTHKKPTTKANKSYGWFIFQFNNIFLSFCNWNAVFVKQKKKIYVKEIFNCKLFIFMCLYAILNEFCAEEKFKNGKRKMTIYWLSFLVMKNYVYGFWSDFLCVIELWTNLCYLEVLSINNVMHFILRNSIDRHLLNKLIKIKT